MLLVFFLHICLYSGFCFLVSTFFVCFASSDYQPFAAFFCACRGLKSYNLKIDHTRKCHSRQGWQIKWAGSTLIYNNQPQIGVMSSVRPSVSSGLVLSMQATDWAEIWKIKLLHSTNQTEYNLVWRIWLKITFLYGTPWQSFLRTHILYFNPYILVEIQYLWVYIFLFHFLTRLRK